MCHVLSDCTAPVRLWAAALLLRTNTSTPADDAGYPRQNTILCMFNDSTVLITSAACVGISLFGALRWMAPRKPGWLTSHDHNAYSILTTSTSIQKGTLPSFRPLTSTTSSKHHKPPRNSPLCSAHKPCMVRGLVQALVQDSSITTEFCATSWETPLDKDHSTPLPSAPSHSPGGKLDTSTCCTSGCSPLV